MPILLVTSRRQTKIFNWCSDTSKHPRLTSISAGTWSFKVGKEANDISPSKFLIPFYTRFSKIEAPFEIQKFVREIRSGQPEAFLKRLQTFFADTPYELASELERHYQNVLFSGAFQLEFHHVDVVRSFYHEVNPSFGRMIFCLGIETYQFEDDEEAIAQIEEKHYARPFETDSRKLFKIGINFSNKTRNIERWIIE